MKSLLSLIIGLFVVFTILKLTNVINWSWWWVTCPLWTPFALFISCVAVAGILMGIAAVFNIGEFK